MLFPRHKSLSGQPAKHTRRLEDEIRTLEARVAALTGHNPSSPWNTEDAFTASAIFLADAGADLQTTAGEIAAAKTYLSGNPKCTKSVCRYYSNRIVALAKEIDRIL